jgi:hypothetical protein
MSSAEMSDRVANFCTPRTVVSSGVKTVVLMVADHQFLSRVQVLRFDRSAFVF